MNPFAVGVKPLKKISCHELYSCPEYVYHNKKYQNKKYNSIEEVLDEINKLRAKGILY